jgi:hypothetical protein
MLGLVYVTFTEGFATVDLLEARDLLDAVAGYPGWARLTLGDADAGIEFACATRYR